MFNRIRRALARFRRFIDKLEMEFGEPPHRQACEPDEFLTHLAYLRPMWLKVSGHQLSDCRHYIFGFLIDPAPGAGTVYSTRLDSSSELGLLPPIFKALLDAADDHGHVFDPAVVLAQNLPILRAYLSGKMLEEDLDHLAMEKLDERLHGVH